VAAGDGNLWVIFDAPEADLETVASAVWTPQ